MFEFPNKYKNKILEPITSKMPYDNSLYNNSYKYWIYSWCVYITQNIVNKDTKILELGPGGLRFILEYFSNHLGLKVYATDLKKKNKKLNSIKNLIYKRESFFNTSYNNNSFDIIFCISVIEHFDTEKIDEFFKEMYRILKPNGKIILSTVEKEWDINKNEIEKSNLYYVPMKKMYNIDGFELEKCGNYKKHPNLNNNNIYFNFKQKKYWTEYCCILKKK